MCHSTLSGAPRLSCRAFLTFRARFPQIWEWEFMGSCIYNTTAHCSETRASLSREVVPWRTFSQAKREPHEGSLFVVLTRSAPALAPRCHVITAPVTLHTYAPGFRRGVNL